MKKLCLLLLGFLPFQTFAKASQDCKELMSEQIRLALTASNLANVNTTRTPEGGPYRPFIIKTCMNGGCDINKDEVAPIMKYLPDHPDADTNGYVAYPNIDAKMEYAVFNITAAKLKLLAKAKACGASILIDNGESSFAVRYNGKGQPNVKEDMFNLNRDRQVVSWMRLDNNGQTTTANLFANGKIATPAQGE